jgi:hypothetical protein
MGDEVASLRARLEASELRHEVNELRSVVAQYQRELRESNKLLLKQRLPPRIVVEYVATLDGVTARHALPEMKTACAQATRTRSTPQLRALTRMVAADALQMLRWPTWRLATGEQRASWSALFVCESHGTTGGGACRPIRLRWRGRSSGEWCARRMLLHRSCRVSWCAS